MMRFCRKVWPRPSVTLRPPLLKRQLDTCSPSCRQNSHRVLKRWGTYSKTPTLSMMAMAMHTGQNDSERVMVIQPEYKLGPVSKPYVPAKFKLEEAVSLVEAIEGWEVHYRRVEPIRKIHNQSFFGKGKGAELKSEVRRLGDEVTGVFINTPKLTPVQHRTLEQMFMVDVFDRFGIVLHIFKERAQTREAKLQVELAEIPYTYMKMFDTTEGKLQYEDHADMETKKYAMKRRLKQLQEELKEIRAKRKQLRDHRAKKSSIPTVAVVGYTNAGKTTLIKALSQDVTMVPKDMLFATLDSTLHTGKLPCGLPVLYVDTIGFVSDLPVELVESFAATLEDSIAADVLVHVIDGSHPQAYAQRANVVKVLEQLPLRPEVVECSINVINKADRGVDGSPSDGDILASAIDGTGLLELETRVQREILRATKQSFWILELPASGPQLSWLYSAEVTVSRVRAMEEEEDRLKVWAVFSEQALGRFLSKFSGDPVTLTPCYDHDLTARTNQSSTFPANC